MSSVIGVLFDRERFFRFILKSLVLFLVVLCSLRYQLTKDITAFELEKAEMERVHANELFSATIHADVQRAMKVDPVKREAEAIARVLYGTARNSTPENQRLVVWCIINRSEHSGYPDSIVEVCEQKNQWMGYRSDNPVVKAYYDLAYEELQSYSESGHRAVPVEYVFLNWSNDQIILRDNFEENGRTHYWKA